MYRVALCDDDRAFCKELEKSCQKILNELNVEHKISLFYCGADLLTAFLDGKTFDLLLLETVIGSINGIVLARNIRNADKDAAIIFITRDSSFALQGYDVKALHYLLKPVDIRTLAGLIRDDYTNRFRRKYIIVEKNLRKTRIAIDDIVCMEIVGRRVEITLLDSMLSYPGKLMELLEQLPADKFIRCHQAYAVNLQNIKELNRTNAVALNNKIIPVSRAYKHEVHAAFLRVMDAL